MRWQDIESKQLGRLEAHVLPADPLRIAPVRRFSPPPIALDELVTYCARVALGFTANAIDVRAALRTAYKSFVDTTWGNQHDDASNSAFAFVAALEGEWDIVGDCTGGALGNRVVIRKTFGNDVLGRARHLATIARGKLPATHALAAMEEVRASFRGDQGELRLLVIATALFVRDIARAEDPVAAARAWLDGEPLELDATRPIAAAADGEDPRVKIFERYAPELSEDSAIAAELARHAQGESWERYLERERNALDDIVIRAFVARLPLPPRWEELVDPLVAAYLGVDTPKLGERLRDLARMRSFAIRGPWEDAVVSLAIATQSSLLELADRERLPTFKPNQFFKDDARKLLGYLASAIAAGASEDAILPAWLDFLSRRSPATTPLIAKEKAPLRWKDLLLIQASITRKLAKRERHDVGRALQLVVTGA